MDSISRKFIPVQGTELEIMSKGYHEGHLYFSTDTKKIYLDANGISKMPMGGNSGIHYGNMQLQETPDEGQKEFEFSIYDIEGNQDDPDVLTIPNINDLILNIPDGSFYRVIEKLDEETLLTHRLTIAGSGGSGGGGGTGTAGSAQMDRLGNQYVTSLYQKECMIGFKLTAVDSSGESTGNGRYELLVGNIKRAEGTAYQGENYIDIGPYLSLGENEVKVIAYMDTGGSSSTVVSKKWFATTTRMELTWNYDSATINNINSVVRLSWSVSGRDLTKITHIIIDDYYEVDPISSTTTSVQTYNLRASEFNLGHGAHKVEIYATTSIGGEDIRTDSIIKNVIFADENDTTPIISCDFFNLNITQYNTVQIPIVIYATTNTAGNAVVYLKEEGIEKDKWEGIKNGEVNYWAYTPTLSGDIVLTIQCGVSEKTLNIYSIALDIDNEEIIDYTFKLKASEFASNNAIQNWNSNGVTASFSEKFDWINGGLKTEDDGNGGTRQYICIKAGSTMTINYDPFHIDARGKGKDFKIIFKATKCKDYDAQVLSCTDGTRGLVMGAQSALFTSTGSQTKTQYCEDQYIEYEIDIAPSANAIKCVQPWLDGIPAGITIYNANDAFNTNTEGVITIGSPDCDVYIYLVKLYERTLSGNEHLQNFIADAPNAEEMVARFRRNDILDDERENEISPTKLAAANPNCLVHLYDIERMTLHKKDKIKNCTYIQYHGSSTPSLTCDNATIKVQGTSSAAYGLAAFNLDSDFSIQEDGTGGFRDENGELLIYKDANGNVIDEYTGMWAMTENSIPVDFFCTKVNVASCEGANNALNQEWYNRYQPYPTLVRLKNPKARDTMEFTPGVLFIKDRNQTDKRGDTTADNKANNVFVDTEGYLADPYYKLYSVCNMGNSKDNIHVLHDTTNPIECCVENGDNQLPGQWMTMPQGGYFEGDAFVAVGLTNINSGETTLCPDGQYRDNRILWETGMDEVYSFRYPDGIEDVKENHPDKAEDMIKGWFDFVDWMAKSNPQEKYKEVKYADADAFAADDSVKYTFDGDYHHVVESDAVFDSEKTYYVETVHVYGATNEKLDQSVTYPGYTFKGYIADATLQKDYDPLIKGCQITTYAGTYTHDTTNYRMAKMLSECEDHLVMDSVLFHFLFIERHSMVDNVAKNTFWSTEDGQRWNLTKDYDNDTADGNNNQGSLELTYGCEPGDLDSKGVSVFNAGNSVWLFFIRNLYPALQRIYQSLDEGSTGAWGPDGYLTLFKEWQSAIPERCWIEDYYRKYIRPYEVYGDTMFLEMLEGGQKTHQRAQYETYQNYYISSKYFGSECKQAQFVMRTNGEEADSPIPIVLYADCYIRAAFGSGTENPNFSRRSKRGEVIQIIPPVENTTDATAYLFPANLYSVLGHPDYGDLGPLNLEQITTQGARKLRILAIGSYDENKSLEEQIKNEGLKTVGFESNELLEELYAPNLTAVHTGSTAFLDLSKAPNLKIVDARGSTFSGIEIADNAAVETIKANNPATIVLSNLKELKTLELQQPEALTGLSINNIDSSQVNSKDILDAATNLERYRLLNVDWTLEGENDVDETANTIAVLERLKTLYPYSSTTGETLSQQDSLTGTITITEEAYDGEDSFEIYDKYAQSDVYPNADIIFESENAKLYTITILNGDGEVYWQRKIEPNANVDATFLADGPNDAFNPAGIIKPDSLQYSYIRKEGYWNVYEGDSTEYTEKNLGESPLYSNVTCDLTFEPVFEETTRVYTLEFYESSADLDPVATTTASYGTPLVDVLPAIVPYKAPGANFDLYEAYSFIGYGLTPTTENPVSSEYKVTVNQKFYAIFEKVDDVRTIVHPEYFESLDFATATLGGDTYVDKYLNPANGTPTKVRETPGVALRPKVHLKGKVTIPSTFEGKPVYGLVDFYKPSSVNKVTELTHVFMEKEGSTLYAIGANAFSSSSSPFDNGLSNLMYFDFSRDTIEYVGYQAFTGASFKEMIGNATLAKELNLSVQNTEYADSYVRLSANLYYVNQQAFAGIFKDKTISKNVTFFVPDTVNYLQGSTPFGLMFYYGNSISNLTFVLGDIDHYVYTYSSGLCDIRFSEGATYTSDGKVYPKFAQNQGYVPVTNIGGIEISNYTVLLRNVGGYSPDTVIEDANDSSKSFLLLDLFQTEGASGLSTAQVTLQIQ